MSWVKITPAEYFAWQTADHEVVHTEIGQDKKGRFMEVELDGPCRLKHRLRPSMELRDCEFWIFYQHQLEEE